MAAEAIERAGVEPLLSACARPGIDENIFGDGVGDEIGIGVVRAPFVGDAVDGAIGVANEETGFQAFEQVWISIVDWESEVFDEDSAVGERPFTGRREVDESVGGQSHPAGFDGGIGPERRINVVRNEVGIRGER